MYPRRRARWLTAVAVVLFLLAGGVLLWTDVITEWFDGQPVVEGQALEALTRLRALTEVGITKQDYSARLRDVQSQVDRSLRAMTARGPLSAAGHAEELALKYYLVADLAWQAGLMHRESSWVWLSQQLPDDAEFAMCPGVRLILGEAEKQRRHAETLSLEALNAVPFWTCAADQLARAEMLIRSVNR